MTQNLEQKLAEFARVASDRHILDDARTTWPDGNLVTMECGAFEAPPSGVLDFYTSEWWFRATCKGCLSARIDRTSAQPENQESAPS